MESKSEVNIGKYVGRHLSQLKILTRLLDHELEAAKGAREVTLDRDLIENVVRDGIVTGEFRSDLDTASVADVIQQLHIDYSTRAYRRDPQFPSHDALIDAACRFVHDAVKTVH